MRENLRRIITGHNDDGKSVVVIEGPPGNEVARGEAGLFEIWNTEGELVDSRDKNDRANSPVLLCPSHKGTKFRWFAVAPDDPGVPKEEAEKTADFIFKMIGASDVQPDTSRHATMHRTKSIDYIILLKGKNVFLMLDEDEREIKPFDVVVQRGTNHAWINRGKETALFIAVLIDAEIK